MALEAGQRAVGRDVGAGPGHPEAWRWSGDLKGGLRVEPWLCHSCCHDLDNHCSEPQFPFLRNGGQLGRLRGSELINEGSEKGEHSLRPSVSGTALYTHYMCMSLCTCTFHCMCALTQGCRDCA